MSLNLDEINVLEAPKNKFSLWWEIKDFVTIFVIIFGFWWLFVNAQLILILIDNISGTNIVKANDIVLAQPTKSISIKTINSVTQKDNGDDMEQLKKHLLELKLNKKLNKFHKKYRTDAVYKPSYVSLLKNNSKTYNIKFNVLPPDARLTIPKIGVDVHIVTLNNIPIERIKKADYDEYLYDWVVKYPYTPDPGKKGNVFIFGHTSYYWWKKNPYGTVFSKIPRLKHDDIMKVTWKWKVYKYVIFKKFVLTTQQVSWIYKKYQNGEFLTIMWCYPIWSDRKRMVIIAKRSRD